MERLHWPQPRTKWRQHDPLNQQLKTQQAARQAEAAQGPQNSAFAGVIDTLLQSHREVQLCVCRCMWQAAPFSAGQFTLSCCLMSARAAAWAASEGSAWSSELRFLCRTSAATSVATSAIHLAQRCRCSLHAGFCTFQCSAGGRLNFTTDSLMMPCEETKCTCSVPCRLLHAKWLACGGNHVALFSQA